jgi:hypothetical protein
MTYPDPSNRYCCASCREGIADPAPVSVRTAKDQQDAYAARRHAYRLENPHLTRQQIEDGAA